jgi:hypothetical protein
MATIKMEMPDGPARCIACTSEVVRIVVVDGQQVWLCPEHEPLLVRPAVVSASQGRVLA